MKFDCGPTWEARKAARERWHRWYAWYPVRVGSRECRWLEYVERKGTYYCYWYADDGWGYEYRPLEGT